MLVYRVKPALSSLVLVMCTVLHRSKVELCSKFEYSEQAVIFLCIPILSKKSEVGANI